MYNTSTNYKNTVLEDSTKHVLKLYIGQRQIEPNHIFDFTINAEMFSDELYLGATPMKSCSFKIHKDEIQSGDKEIRVVSGIEGEEIPMGTFVFEDVKEVDFFTYEITAVDYMYKFEGAYDTDLDFSEGVTLLEILSDLCEKSDVVLGSESFLNDDTVIAVYDSTLQRKEYLSYIAEQAGGFAIIGRDNKLYINTFNHVENASELNLNNFKSFKWGQSIDISKIAYEDGIQDFKKGDDSGSTLWIAQKNMYITSQSQIDNIYDELTETEREIEEEGTSITIEDSKEGVKIDYSIKGNTTQNGTPTPTTPIEVNNVTGEQVVTISNGTDSKSYEINLGKSIYEGSSDLYGNIKEYSQFTREDLGENVLKLTKTTSGSTSPRFFVSLVQGKTYSVQLKAKGNCTKIEVGTWVDNTQTIQANIVPNENNFTTMSFTFTYSGSNPRIYIRNNDTNVPLDTYIIIKDFMIEEGSQVTSYSPYFTPIELNKIGTYQDFIRKGTGKNLLNLSNVEIGKAWNGDTNSARAVVYINCKPNTTYTISYNNISAFDGVYNFEKASKSDTTVTSATSQITSTKTITTKAESNVLGLQFNKTSISTTDFENLKIQIEKGSTKTDYEPFGYKNKWYIEKNIDNVVLNGTETWTGWTSQDFTNTILVGTIKIDNIGKIANLGFCDRFSNSTNLWSVDTEGIQIKATGGNQVVIRVSKSVASDYTTFKTWLQTNNTKVYYVLANPTYTLIENEELLNQLEELDNATLMEGTTNILVSGDLPFIMNLDFEVRNRNFYQFEGGSIVDPANDLGDVVIIDEKPVIFEGKMSYLGKWYIDVNSTALVKDKAHSMNTKADTRARIKRVESEINQIDGIITQVVEATNEIASDYVTATEYTDYKSEQSQTMNNISQEVSRTTQTLYGDNDDGLVKQVEQNTTTIEQNSENITLSVERISGLETKTEELDDNTEKIIKSFNFGNDGLTISNQGSDEDDGANINIDNEDIKIRIGALTKLLINGSGIYYDSASFNKLDLGEFAIVAEENGFLSIIYEGGN